MSLVPAILFLLLSPITTLRLIKLRGSISQKKVKFTPLKSTFIGDDYDEFERKDGQRISPQEEEALLEAFRIQKQLENDRWQSCTFRDEHCGRWEGLSKIYILDKILTFYIPEIEI